MKAKRLSHLFALCSSLVAITTSGCSNIKETFSNIFGKPVVGEGYYADINAKSGAALKDQLTALNKKKRKSVVGYKPMLNDPEHGYYVTDPGDGPKTITSYYSGKSINGTSGLNREHVWPDSRGGNLVDSDIHMTRPTLQSENGNRGNSFYVEGKKSSSSGWDPAATDFGKEEYRGDCARIIFYCVIAAGKDSAGNYKLSIIDKENDSTSNKTMGKLSNLLEWNRKYPPTEREKIRNNGAEKLQGNRNPFIDHPEYVDLIWTL